MIRNCKKHRTSLLDTALQEALYDDVVGVTFFVNATISPNEIARLQYVGSVFFHDRHSASQSIIAKLASPHALCHCRESIFGIPFKRAGPIEGKITIRVVR